MSTFTDAAAVGSDGAGVARAAGGQALASVAHPTITDTLGRESVDQLVASANGVVSSAAAAAEALHASVRVASIAAKADDLMASHPHESALADSGDAPDMIDVGKLREATAKLREVLTGTDALATSVERIFSDQESMSRIRERFAASDDGVDLEIVRGALASVQPGDVPLSQLVAGVSHHVAAAGKQLPSDAQEAVKHLEDVLADLQRDFSSIIVRFRDVSLAAVAALG